eukprot:snap_masked-scaffold_44-processed-gene-1.22-mRNA-1 protein AED:1.00 eAED:1.00 QI:0/0/0/0/1/1/3/0/61
MQFDCVGPDLGADFEHQYCQRGLIMDCVGNAPNMVVVVLTALINVKLFNVSSTFTYSVLFM